MGIGTQSLFVLVTLTLFYEYLEFSNVYTIEYRDKQAAVGIGLEDVCLDAVKKYRYRKHVNCDSAEITAQEGVYAAAFRAWWESRYLYRIITLDDISTKIGGFLLAALTLYLVFSYRWRETQMKNQMLPWAYNTGDTHAHKAIEWIRGRKSHNE